MTRLTIAAAVISESSKGLVKRINKGILIESLRVVGW
jgi:hypothetical protein